MSSTRIEATRYVAAPPAVIFALLCDPAGHVAIDSSGMLQSFSAGAAVAAAPEAVIETTAALAARTEGLDRVRWLSREPAPSVELLGHGLSVDRRALAQRGDIEMARWLLEQSVSITHHRYGNVNAGPKPTCNGLGPSVFES